MKNSNVINVNVTICIISATNASDQASIEHEIIPFDVASRPLYHRSVTLDRIQNVCLLDTAKHVKLVRVLYVSGIVLTLVKCVLVQMNAGKLVYQVVRAIANFGFAFPQQLNCNYFLFPK